MNRLLWFLALGSLATAGSPAEEDADVRVAKRIAAALPSGETTVADLLKRLAPDRTDEDREIGFGARRLRLSIDGDATTTVVTVLAWHDRVGSIEVRCNTDDTELRDRIAAAYKGRGTAPDAEGLTVMAGAPADPKGFRDERAKVLGGPLAIEPAPEVASAYLLLWSPFSDLVYGKMYGEDGAPPKGREALEKLLAHKQGVTLLQDILRGPNPEGRLYAAEGLIRLQKKGTALDDQAKKDIEWVREADLKVQVCRGCEMTRERAATPLKEMLEDE